MKITLDANVLDSQNSELLAKAESVGFDVLVATVIERERGRPDITDILQKTPEVFVIGQSQLDVGALGSDDDQNTFEHVLRVISNGSFPAKDHRERLSPGEERQLRDAMAFATHVRDRRDIFITDDTRGFIRHGRRASLESTYDTRIMTTQEFLEYLESR